MAKAADITTKRMIGSAAKVWVKWTAPVKAVSECEVIASEYQWLGRASDVVLRVKSPGVGEFILIIEIQLYFDPNMPVRLRAYSGLAEEKHGLPVYPVLINLLPPGPSTEIVERYESNFLGLQARQDFRVINVWEIDVEEIFAADVALWPLATLSRGGKDEIILSRAKERIAANKRLRREGRVSEVEAELATMSSFVFGLKVIDKHFGERMSDWVVNSPLYKAIVQETRMVALEEGRQEGRQELLIRQLQGRFGALDKKLLARLRKLTSAQLDALAEAVFGFQNRDDLAAWLAREAVVKAKPQNGVQKS